jgi:molecular chaperone GrpE (heat shock protein)
MNKNQLKELKNILESEQNKYKKLKTKFWNLKNVSKQDIYNLYFKK